MRYSLFSIFLNVDFLIIAHRDLAFQDLIPTDVSNMSLPLKIKYIKKSLIFKRFFYKHPGLQPQFL